MTKAMILAAGSGKRMLPLTGLMPKVLLPVNGKPLIVHHLLRLAASGINDIVINLAHFPEQIQQALGDGSQFDVKITYSPEPPGGLETAGGIIQALPLLGEQPFIVVNGDIYCDYPFDQLQLRKDTLAHLVLVANPPHHPQGDFYLQDDYVHNEGPVMLTYAGISIYQSAFFKACTPGFAKLAPLIREAATHQQVTGEYYTGRWLDVGTPDRFKTIQFEKK